MKRVMKFIGILLAVFLMCRMPVRAETPSLVQDDGQVLSSSEVQNLNELARQVSDAHNFGIYVVTLPNSVESYGFSTIEDLAEAVYTAGDLGTGDEKEGIMLILTMEDGLFDIFVKHSAKGDEAFSQYAREEMADTVVYDYLRYEDFYGGFRNFISIADTDLSYQEAGTPLSPTFDPAKEAEREEEKRRQEEASRAARTGATFGIPPLTALLACLGMRSKNKTAGIKREANNYIAKNGINLTTVQDLFLYRNETRTRIHRDEGGGGGSSFHSSSTSMGSHTSGSFRG